MRVRTRPLVTSVVLGVIAAILAGLAVASHGFPIQHVSLNDGGIWVTDNSIGSIGRFAKPVAELDGQVTPPSVAPAVDVWQNGTMVAAYDATGGRIYAVNAQGPSFSDAGAPVSPVPGGIALGNSTLAVLSTDHAVRAATLLSGGGSLGGLAASAAPLAAHLPPNAAVAVGADGTVFVAGGGDLHALGADGAGPAGGTVSSIPLSASDPMQVTAVGDVPVVADAATKTLFLPDSGYVVRLPAADTSAGLRLQQASDAGTVVVVATSAALYSVDLSTGQLSTLSAGHSGTAAAPVQVADCVHAAWYADGAGSYVRTCGSPPPATKLAQSFSLGDTAANAALVFRVNNDEVVLNDTANGGVFLVDTAVASVHPAWVKSATAAGSSSTHNIASAKTQLKANPYTQGVRPGRTTAVHVLDADKGSPGVTYAVTAVGSPDQPGVRVAVAPDGQTVLATVGQGLTSDVHFQYTIDDGRGHSASAEVTLVPRAPGQNGPPALKPYYQPPPLAVASGGTLAVPVIGDWRDPDGDPLYIDTGSVTASAGAASVTSGGTISFTAPRATARQTVTISYAVSDGIVARPTRATLKVAVEGSAFDGFVAPVAEPDAAQAVAGSPLTLRPLANDVPGVDPTNPAARLTIAAPVADVAGAAVSTDLAAGTVTLTAQHPGDLFLSYTDAYGAAPTATGTIRVHVVPASGTPRPPVTTPDVAVLHGHQPAVLDALADDYDPQGWILGVTGATTSTPGLQVAVVDQRWLRISANNPVPGSLGTVTYTVSDGKSAATGTVAVTAAPASPDADQISTEDASITVRAGDSSAVPVLAGDASSTGLPLSLSGTPPAAGPPIAGLRVGVQAGSVRVTAPAGVSAEEETTVSYVVTDASGAVSTGRLEVTIEPAPDSAHPDQAPSPQEVDARETAGDVTVIHIPVYGVDPDGDSVTVTAITGAPALGRIVALGPDSISYQSYPGSSGTDTFSYQVTDPYGRTGTGQVRVAVLPPGLPQPPVAVDDAINAPPGVTLHWNVLGNDYLGADDTVTVEPLAKTNHPVPAGVKLAGAYVYLRVPASPADPPVQLTYGDTDGSGAPSLAQLTVHPVPGARVPPIAADDIASAPAPGARTLTVNVLRNDDDPVGSPSDLKISWAPQGTRVEGGSLVIPVTAQPREVPYQVTAPDGLTATAVVFVPGASASQIRLRKGARITLSRNGSVTVPLTSILLDTAGRQLKITTTDQLTASPAGQLTVDASTDTAITVHALGGYTGPGEVSVQVYDGATLQDPLGHVATVEIPVQVGPDTPILRCPGQPVQLAEGGAAQFFDIGRLCHVWVDPTVSGPAPRYTVSWGKALAGVSATVSGGTTLRLVAGSGALPGSSGALTITPAGGGTGATLKVAVIRAPLPVGRPVSVTAKAGARVTVDLSQYVTSPLAQPDIQVLGVTTPPVGTTVTTHGPAVTITLARTAKAAFTVTATVTDVAGRSDRAIGIGITVTVLGQLPGAPGPPSVAAASRTLLVSFGPAASNGTPIEFYTVHVDGSSHQCLASPCTVTGLANGKRYTVYVTATSAAGTGPRSATVTAEPVGVPGQVTALTTATGAGKVTLSWASAQADGPTVSGYQVEISPDPAGQPPITSLGAVTSHVFAGLVDGTRYTFRVLARNSVGTGPWSTPVSAVPYGRPSAPSAPAATGAAVPNPSATRAVTVTWTAPADNGSAITGYTVDEYASAAQGGPWGTPAVIATVAGTATTASFDVPSGGDWYEFSVAAANAAGTSPQSPLSTPPVQAIAPPGALTGLTASDHPAGSVAGYNNAIHISFTVPAAGGKQVASIEYGINAAAETGTIPGPFAAGATPDLAITSAMTAAIANGTPVTVYVAACNNGGQCSAWTGPSNQVTPYGPPNAPQATATAGGTQITYAWGGGGNNGRPVASYHVCIDGACTNQNAGGTRTVTYGAGGTHTLTVYVVDTAGQQSATATAQATATPQAPPTTPVPGPTTTQPQPGPTTPTPGPGPTTTTSGAGTPPAAPSNLTATAVDPNDISLTWQDNSADENGFEINNGVTSQDAAANSTSYTWGGLAPGTYMCFRVRAYNDAGDSPWTPDVNPFYVCTTTPQNPPPTSSSPPPPACNPSVSISPGSGPVGTQFTVTGTGWLSGGRIAMTDSASGLTWLDPTADANGNWQTTMTAGNGSAGVTHTLTFSESGCSSTATGTVTVTAPVCNTAQNIAPGSGPAGTQFVISGSAWPPGDVLTFDPVSGDYGPAGLGLPASVTVGSSGSWQATGTIPATATTNDVYTIFINDTGGCSTYQGPTVTFTVTAS